MPPRRHTLRTAAALVLLGLVAAVCAALGNWQLDRAQLRRDIAQSMAQGRASPMLALQSDTPASALTDWRPASAQGTWRHDLTVLVENRNHAGKPGYWVATPLQLDTGAHAILVLRGWIPRRFDHQPAAVPIPMDAQRIHGQLLPHVPRIYELPSLSGTPTAQLPPQPGATPPTVVNLSLDDYARYTGLPLLPAVLQQFSSTPGDNTAALEPDGLVREWAGPALDADKNTGYAIQWFGFAAIAAGAWIVIAWRTWRRRRPH